MVYLPALEHCGKALDKARVPVALILVALAVERR